MCPKQEAPCFILGGRYGDIIQLMPAFKAVADRTGLKPIVITSSHYASVFEGVSYVQCEPMHFDWWELPAKALPLSRELYGGATVVQWWHDDPARIALIEQATAGGIVLQSHGREWGVDINRWPDYGTSMWDRAGFTREEMMTLPLVFDRRDQDRESNLVRQYKKNRPLLLVNFTGHSSPFPPHPEVMREVEKLARFFTVVDLGRIKAIRIYDLLGLMDAAVGMITTDTATMHLALGSNVPYLGYTVNGWTSSVPKGNCVLHIKYNESMQRLGEVAPLLEKWLGQQQPAPVPTRGGGGELVL